MSTGRAGSRPTSRDIARLAGVSQATVSNAVNRPHLVAEATRSRILDAMASGGYLVNTSARTLRSGINPAIGVVVLDVGNPFWGELIRGIESVTVPRRIPLIIGSSSERPEIERQILETFESHGVGRVLVAPTTANLPLLRTLQAQGMRVALLDREDPEGALSAVSLDHAAGAASAARFLLDGGHRRLAMVNGSHAVAWCASRSRGFRAAVADRAGAQVRELRMNAMSAEEGLRSVAGLLALAPRPTAVFCANDMLALGVLKGLARAGLSVPADMSVVGYDDALFAELLSPALTTVRQSAGAIGREAALRVLDEAAAGGVLPAPQLVVRESTRTIIVPSRPTLQSGSTGTASISSRV